MAEMVATFSIKMEGNVSDVAKGDAASLEKLRDSIESSQASIKRMVAQQSLLKGSSEEIKSARQGLTNSINAERAAVSANALQLGKMGTTYGELADKARGAARASAGTANEARALHGQMTQLRSPIEAVGESLSSLKGAGGAMGAIVTGATLAIAAVLALGAVVIAGAVAFGKWAIEGANANRANALTRESFEGSADGAERLAFHINQLASKVPTSKAAIQELALSLRQAKFGGQLFADSLEAIGQAEAGVAGYGGKVRSLLERGILPNGTEGRFRVTALELREVGISFRDLGASMARTSGKSVAQATSEFQRGVVPIGEAAKAMRDAVERRFGRVNAMKMLDLDVMKSKLGESLRGLTSGINLEPLLVMVQKFFALFDTSTDAGAAIKTIVTLLGNDLVGVLAKVDLEGFFYEGLIASVDFLTGLYKIKNAVVSAFSAVNWGPLKDLVSEIDFGRLAFYGLAGAMGIATLAIGALGVALAVPLAPFIALGVAAAAAYQGIKAAYAEIKAINWGALGTSIIDGIVNALTPTRLIEAMRSLGKSGLEAFKGALGIHSPSRVFAEAGAQIPAGVEQGIRTGTPDVESAVGSMASPKSLAAKPLSSSGGGSSTVINITLNAAGATPESVAAVSDAGFLAKLTHAIEEACKGAGVPIMVGTP